MRFYAERPSRLARQVLADALVLAWVAWCVLAARAAHDMVLRLQGPGQEIARTGADMQVAFDDAARTASRVPLIGNDLARAFESGSAAARSLIATGQEQIDTLSTMATSTAVTVLVAGAVPVIALWLWLRIRYARSARSAIEVRDLDTDLLALRALTHLPVRQLVHASPDPASAWRQGDRAAIHRLAELELRSLGLWAPSQPPD